MKENCTLSQRVVGRSSGAQNVEAIVSTAIH